MLRYHRTCQYRFKDGHICGRPFTTAFVEEVLCRRCRRRLPKCRACHEVIGPEYGYAERAGQKVGRYTICATCVIQMMRKGLLQISETQVLLPSGKIKVVKSSRLP